MTTRGPNSSILRIESYRKPTPFFNELAGQAPKGTIRVDRQSYPKAKKKKNEKARVPTTLPPHSPLPRKKVKSFSRAEQNLVFTYLILV